MKLYENVKFWSFETHCLYLLLNIVCYNFSLVARHVHGTATDIDLQVVVQNFGEDSYESQLHLQLPYGVSYVQIHHVQPVCIYCKKGLLQYSVVQIGITSGSCQVKKRDETGKVTT